MGHFKKTGATMYDSKAWAKRNREIEDWVDHDHGIGAEVKTVPVKARANYKAAKTNRQSVFHRAQNCHWDQMPIYHNIMIIQMLFPRLLNIPLCLPKRHC